jgi:hypothetical protein
VSAINRDFKGLGEADKLTKVCKVSAIRINTASEYLKKNVEGNVLFKDLIQEDWRNFVVSFYFPKRKNVLTDERIKTFLE